MRENSTYFDGCEEICFAFIGEIFLLFNYKLTVKSNI